MAKDRAGIGCDLEWGLGRGESIDCVSFLSALKEERVDAENVSLENIQTLLKHLDESSVKDPSVGTASEILAILSKTECQRVQLASAGAIPILLSEKISNGYTNVFINCLRTVANIVYENDSNRQLVLDCKGIDAIFKYVKYVNSHKNVNELPDLYPLVAAGCICNLIADNENIAHEICDKNYLKDALELLLAANANPNMSGMMFAAIIGHNEAFMLKEFTKEENLFMLFRCIGIDNNDDLQREIKITLDSITQEDELCDIIYKHVGLRKLVQHVLGCNESNVKVKEAIANVTSSLLGVEECKYIRFINENEDLVEMFIEWTNDEVLNCAGALALGNLARSEENTDKLNSMKALKSVIGMLSGTTDAKVQHAALGYIKNTSISTCTRQAIIDYGFLDVVNTNLIDTIHGAIQFQVASILKNLSRNENICVVIVNNTTAMDLIDKLSRSDEEGIRFEATRAFAYLLRGLISVQDNDKQLKYLITDTNCIESVVKMVTSKFDHLKNEALVALNMIATCDSIEECDKNSILFQRQNLIDGLFQAINHEKVMDEVKANAIVLMIHARKSGVEIPTWLVNDLNSHLDKLIKHENKGIALPATTLKKIL